MFFLSLFFVIFIHPVSWIHSWPEVSVRTKGLRFGNVCECMTMCISIYILFCLQLNTLGVFLPSPLQARLRKCFSKTIPFKYSNSVSPTTKATSWRHELPINTTWITFCWSITSWSKRYPFRNLFDGPKDEPKDNGLANGMRAFKTTSSNLQH